LLYSQQVANPLSLIFKIKMMKKNLSLILLYLVVVLSLHIPAEGQTKTVKKGAKYDTIIVKHTSPSSKKAVPKPAAIQEIILPIPNTLISLITTIKPTTG
jgi:hypothetical protein